MKTPTIALVGAGNVAFHLARAFYKANISVTQVCNRSYSRAEDICNSIGAKYIDHPSKIERSDFIILAVSDYAITPLSKQIPNYVDTVVAHTSGSVSIDVLSHRSNYGGFYPLQSFRRKRELDLRKIPVLVSAHQLESKKRLFNLARLISNIPIIIGDKERSILHLPAVMVNNFTNHLYAQARDICDQNGLDFDLLLPLIEETVTRLSSGEHPSTYQTGPAIRNDINTIRNHQSELQSESATLELYNFLTKSIQDYHK